MKKLIGTVHLCALLVVGASCAAATQTAGSPADMTLEDVLAAYYTAAGGEEKLAAVETLKLVGERQEPARIGAEKAVPFEIVFAQPNSLRLDLTIRDDQYTQAVNGDSGWQIWPAWGNYEPQDLTADLINSLRKEFEMINELYRHEEKGHSLELKGLTQLDEQNVFHIVVGHATGETRDYYLDAETHLPIKMITTRQFGGADYAIELDISEYKEVDGLLLAHESVLQLDGKGLKQLIKLVVKEAQVNPDVAPDFFTRPEAPAAPEAAETEAEAGR